MDLLTIALAPVLFLIVFIYQKDVINKEPKSELAKVFVGGAVFSVVATLIFGNQIIPWLWGDAEDWDNSFLSVFGQAFVEAAIPEEFFKFVVLYFFVWKNKHFDENFDGIVYAVFVSMGFACTENILYVVGGGVITGYFRALTAVPGHFLFAVIMGYYFSLAKFNPETVRSSLCKSLGFAILAHGIYDGILMSMSEFEVESPIAIVAFYAVFIVFLVKLWKIGLKKIDELREKDILTLPKDHPQRVLYDKRQKWLNKNNKKKGGKNASAAPAHANANAPTFDPWANDKMANDIPADPGFVSPRVQLPVSPTLSPQPQALPSDCTMALSAPDDSGIGETQALEIPDDFNENRVDNFNPIQASPLPTQSLQQLNSIAPSESQSFNPSFNETRPVSSFSEISPVFDPTFKEVKPVSPINVEPPIIDPTFKEVKPISPSGEASPMSQPLEYQPSGDSAAPNPSLTRKPASNAEISPVPQAMPQEKTFALLEPVK